MTSNILALVEEEELDAVITRETEFEFQGFLNKYVAHVLSFAVHLDHIFKALFLFCCRLVNPSIIQPYCWLLQFYQKNTMKTNHCIVKMLHRIAIDIKMYPMLFQLSLFMVFNKILHCPNSSQYQVSSEIDD